MTLAPAEREALAARWAPYARNLAASYARRLHWLADEMESAALMGLALALDRYDPGRGDFMSYVRGKVLSEVREACRNLDHLSRRHRADVKAGVTPDILIYPSGEVDTGKADRTDDHDLDTAAQAARMLDALPHRLATVMRWRFFDDLDLKETGERLGVTESRACQMITKAERLLRFRFYQGA